MPSVYVDPKALTGLVHLAALGTLPAKYSITQNQNEADVVVTNNLAQVTSGEWAVISEPYVNNSADLRAAISGLRLYCAPLSLLAIEAVQNSISLGNDDLSGTVIEISIHHQNAASTPVSRLAALVAILQKLGLSELQNLTLSKTDSGILVGAEARGAKISLTHFSSSFDSPGLQILISNPEKQTRVHAKLDTPSAPIVVKTDTSEGTAINRPEFVNTAKEFWQNPDDFAGLNAIVVDALAFAEASME